MEMYGSTASGLRSSTPTESLRGSDSYIALYREAQVSSPGKRPKTGTGKLKKTVQENVINEEPSTTPSMIASEDKDEQSTLEEDTWVSTLCEEDDACVDAVSDSLTVNVEKSSPSGDEAAKSNDSVENEISSHLKTFKSSDSIDSLQQTNIVPVNTFAVENTLSITTSLGSDEAEKNLCGSDSDMSASTLKDRPGKLIPRPPSSPPSRKSSRRRPVRQQPKAKENSIVYCNNRDSNSSTECRITTKEVREDVSKSKDARDVNCLPNVQFQSPMQAVCHTKENTSGHYPSVYESVTALYKRNGNRVFTPTPPPKTEQKSTSFKRRTSLPSRDKAQSNSFTDLAGENLSVINDNESTLKRNDAYQEASSSTSMNLRSDSNLYDYSFEEWESYTSSPDVGRISGSTSRCSSPEMELPRIPSGLYETPALVHYRLEREYKKKIGSSSSLSSNSSSEDSEPIFKIHKGYTLDEKLKLLNQFDSDESQVSLVAEDIGCQFGKGNNTPVECVRSYENMATVNETESHTLNTLSDQALPLYGHCSLENANGKFKLPKINSSSDSIKVKSKKKKTTADEFRISAVSSTTNTIERKCSSVDILLKSHSKGSARKQSVDSLDNQSDSNESMGRKPTIAGVRLMPLEKEDFVKPPGPDSLCFDPLQTKRKVLDPIGVHSDKKALKKSSKK